MVMERRKLYGGERGILSRDQAVVNKLFDTAQSDFAHDFGEGVPARDKFVDEDSVRFLEIAQSYGVKNVKALVTVFDSVVGSNPFTLLQSTLASKIFPGRGDSKEINREEEKALENLGINYQSIKDQFKSKLRTETGKETAIKIKDLVFSIPGGGQRTYEVSGILMKDKIGEGVLNVASRFEKVTNGNTKVALIIDASGGLSMTSLLNSDLPVPPNNKMDFYIIENIENDSDSATKLKTFDKPKIPSTLQPNVYFLEDEINTVLYPKFETAQAKSDAELLFGSANLVLSRAGDEMEADFKFDGDPKEYHIENVSQNANVKNASLNIIASTLAKDGTVDKIKGITVPGDDKTPYLFPYIKRVGDWCQALSLLDGTRKYNILDTQHNPTNKQTTLDDLRKEGAAIGLLTLDRILLGYALTLGIDVFFTTATDLRMLIYFRNTETQMTPEELQAKTAELQRSYDTELATIGQDNVATILDEAVEFVKGSTTDTDYIRRLRGALYRVSVLRTDFATITQKVNEITAKVKTNISPQEKYSAYFEGITLLRKLKADEKHNQTQRTSFNTYPALVDEKGAFTMMDMSRPSRNAIAKLKMILSKDIFNDATQSKKVFEKYGKTKRLVELVSIPIKNPAVFTDIFEALAEVKRLFGEAQRGGAREDIELLKQFVVTPVAVKVYKENSENLYPEVDDPPPMRLVLGSFYRGKDMLPYTVVNEYIITKEDLPIFQRILRDKEINPEDEKFVATRLMLLYADMIRADFEKLLASDDAEIIEETRTSYPSDIWITNHKRIYYKISELMDIGKKFLTTGRWKEAFQEAFNSYEAAELIDNEEVNKIYGREAPRNEIDYPRTEKKLFTLQKALCNIIVQSTPSRPGTKRGRDQLA